MSDSQKSRKSIGEAVDASATGKKVAEVHAMVCTTEDEEAEMRRDPQAALFPLVSCRSSMVPSGSARRRGARSGVEAERPVVMRAVAPPARPQRHCLACCMARATAS